jgi:hypothetical protein
MDQAPERGLAHGEPVSGYKNFSEGVGMALIDLAAEKARIWGKRLQTAGISADDMAYCLGVTSDQMISILSGEIPLGPDLELAVQATLHELERQRREECRHSRRAL